jgi:heme/copper-type cytochrome/quinol oxidase subunit 2
MKEASTENPEAVPTPAEARLKRTLILSLVIVGILMLGMMALLVVLAVDAYRSPVQPSPGAAVVSLLRDAAIILVAFETLLIGVLLIVLTIQVQALVSLLRDEIRPMLETINDTLATVRGTTRFVSHHVVSPTIQAASFVAGVRRVLKEIRGFFSRPK